MRGMPELVSEMVQGYETFINPDTGRQSSYAREGYVRAWVPQYLSASDYSGNDGGVVRANVNVFEEDFSDLEGSVWWGIGGGYGTFGIAIRDDAPSLIAKRMLDDTDEQALIRTMLEAVAGLEDYPYLPGAEEVDSERQVDQQAEEWADYAGREFVEKLAAALGYDEEGELDFSVDLTMRLYFALADQFSVYPSTEGSGDNTNVVWYFDSWFRSFEAVLAAWEPRDGTPNPLAEALLLLMAEGEVAPFEYGGWVNNVFRFTRDQTRTRAALEVFRDWVEENGPEAALDKAGKKDAKLAGFVARSRRA